MSFEINQRFLKDVRMDDKLYYESLIAELESLIETEISKNDNEINDEFIDECCMAIEYLRSVQSGEETEPYETVVDIEAIIKSQHRKARVVYVSSAACAAVAVLCAVISLKFSTVNEQGYLSQYESSGDLYEKTETNGSNNVTSQISQTTGNTTTVDVSTTEQIVTDIILPPDITQPVPMIYKMEVLLAPGSSFIVSDEAQIEMMLANSSIVATYTDDSVDFVSIDECQVEIGTQNENGEVKVTITYKNMSTDVYVTVDPDVVKNPLYE